MLDLKGPIINTGYNRDNKPVELKEGQKLKIVITNNKTAIILNFPPIISP